MFDIPNLADAAFRRQAGIYKADLDGALAAVAGDGVISGCAVTAQGTPDMTVAVAAGLIRVQGFFAYVVGANVSIAAADGSLDRIDLIAVDYNGALSRVAGTAAAKPVAPQYPSNSIVLAQVYVPAADTAINANQIVDKRAFTVDWFDVYDEFVTSGLATTGNQGALGWGASASGTAANAYQAGVSKHPGIYRLQSGTTSGNNSRLHLRAAATDVALVPADVARVRFLLQIPTITTLAVKIGLGVDLSVATAGELGSAGAFIEFVPATSAKWRYTTRQASTSTTNADTGADVAANTWYQFDLIRKQNGNQQFLKNGALMFEHSANLPTSGVNLGALVHTLTAAARNIDLDFIGINYAPLGQRWT